MKWILFIVALSLVIGGLVGVITSQFASFIGSTVLSGALIFSIAAYFSRRKERAPGKAHDDTAESMEVEAVREEPGLPDVQRDPIERDRMIEVYIVRFGINRDKAENLYDVGYARWVDFAEVIPEDLLMVEGINPTVARKIISTVRSQ